MTVSRTLRDDPQVTQEAAARVIAAVEALGYQRNETARLLRLGQPSGVIGLIITNLANPFYAELALGVEAAAGEHGSRVMFGNSAGDVARERQLVRDFTARRLDAIIVTPAAGDHRHLYPARLAGMPVVLAAHPPAGFDADCVLLDDFGGSQDATRRLIAAGHSKIAFLGLAPATWTGSERFRGYCAALEEAGIALDEQIVTRERRDVAGAERAMLRLLGAGDPPTAVFTANNRNTIGACRAIRASRADIAVAGFDDFELAELLAPLTVVSYDPRELGRRAADLLRDGVAGQRPAKPAAARRVVVPTRLVGYGS